MSCAVSTPTSNGGCCISGHRFFPRVLCASSSLPLRPFHYPLKNITTHLIHRTSSQPRMGASRFCSRYHGRICCSTPLHDTSLSANGPRSTSCWSMPSCYRLQHHPQYLLSHPQRSYHLQHRPQPLPPHHPQRSRHLWMPNPLRSTHSVTRYHQTCPLCLLQFHR